MNKNTFEKVTLNRGVVGVYDFGEIKLHAYQTNDPIDDEVFVVERGGKAVLIESPCFFDNNRELDGYLQNLDVAGIFLSYHMAGGSFLPGAKKYATKNADEYGHRGGGKALIDNFNVVFGDVFDHSILPLLTILQKVRQPLAGLILRSPKRPMRLI